MNLNQTSYSIHIFGDSHSRIYSSPYLSNYICSVYYTGPITMHRIGRDKPTLQQLKEMSKTYYNEYLPKAKKEYQHMRYPTSDEVRQNDIVIFVFGEIDIRNHYAKQIEKGRNPKDVLEGLVNAYIETVLQNREKTAYVKFGVQSINPPVDEKNLKESIKEYPIQGTIEQRIEATQQINVLLKQRCQENNLLFIDTATYYQNDDSLFPRNGINSECKLYELDARIKDNNVHVHMENPEGIEHAFKVANMPVNIMFHEYSRKCKYQSSLNQFQRDTYIRLRLAHHVVIFLMLCSLFLPVRYILLGVGFWLMVILLNIILGNGVDCWFNVIEFRIGNCNNYSALDELWIPKTFRNPIILTLYCIGIAILLLKTYIFVYNKTPPFMSGKLMKFIY